MFYDVFDDLCRNSKIAPSALARKLGMSSSAPGRWKSGSNPDLETAARIADFFGVTVDYLLGRESDKKIEISSTGSVARTDASCGSVVLGSYVGDGSLIAGAKETDKSVLTEQEQELLNIFRSFDMRGKTKALMMLFDLKDSLEK